MEFLFPLDTKHVLLAHPHEEHPDALLILNSGKASMIRDEVLRTAHRYVYCDSEELARYALSRRERLPSTRP